MPTFNAYTEQEIFEKTILPLVAKFPELPWFTEPGVAITQQTASKTQTSSWGSLLANLRTKEGKPYTTLPEGGKKYVELERMLSSIVCLHLLLDGSEKAYTCFTQHQATDLRLSFRSFQTLSILFNETVTNEDTVALVEAVLVYSDLGKTPSFKTRNATLSAQYPDHDDVLEAFFTQDAKNICEVLPSFVAFSLEQQKQLLAMITGMKVHLGHVFHLEGGPKMFAKLETALQKGISPKALDLAFLVQFCDVAASEAHGVNMGSLALTEPVYQGYQCTGTALLTLKESGKKEDAFSALLKARATQWKMPMVTPLQKTAVRLACMARATTPKEATDILQALERFLKENSDHCTILMKYFEPNGHESIDSWNRNPTYVPTVIINTLNVIGRNPNTVVQCAAIMAEICHLYIKQNGHLSPKPLSFNQLAKTAATATQAFLAWDFKPGAIQFSSANDVTMDEKALIENTVLTSATTPQFKTTKEAEKNKGFPVSPSIPSASLPQKDSGGTALSPDPSQKKTIASVL